MRGDVDELEAVAAVYEAAIAEAVAAERERCAKMAEKEPWRRGWRVAELIRKGTP
jgi:hypothetical protein